MLQAIFESAQIKQARRDYAHARACALRDGFEGDFKATVFKNLKGNSPEAWLEAAGVVAAAQAKIADSRLETMYHDR